MRHYSVEELADIYNVHPETIRRPLRRGELKGYKFGRGWRIKEDDWKKYLESTSNVKSKEGVE